MHPSPARLPSRRAVLGLGVVGTSLVLSGCGLRLDVPPAVPEPDALDSLRNDVARILSATEPPAAGSAELDELRAAVGPVWAPPTELVTPTATPTPVSFDFADGTAAAVERFAEGLPAVVGERGELAPIGGSGGIRRGAVLGLFDTPGAAFLAAAQLWFTGEARARTGERQLLRYAIRDAATASPNAEGDA
ncbi:hypothetical protein [Brevibacterium ihuae]|uniref:hypothetical protein n=1 Tax=Brevibacterium ihuae TaxID=1631743 RepID=UPI0011AEE163|nr:hypothetical protein [Brevibacterium ihuae]